MDRQQEPIGKKLVLEFFVKNYLCNSIGLFVSPAFLFFNNRSAPYQQSLKG